MFREKYSEFINRFKGGRRVRYRELREPCRSAIEEGRCAGCSRLELEEFEGDEGCKMYEKKKEWSRDWRVVKWK